MDLRLRSNRVRSASTGMVLAAAVLAWTMPTHASTVTVFEDLPSAPSNVESHHNAAGPILADDFVPASSGRVSRVEWWGSRAASPSWELVFQTNSNTNHPNIDNAFDGALVKYVNVVANGVADVPGQPSIFHYTADLGGPLLIFDAGVEYWFTVANFFDGWTWALALGGPTVGSENFDAHRSVGAGPCLDGGPHCGPWENIHTDFAFRISSLPEPGTAALAAAIGFALAASTRRRRRPPTEEAISQ